MRNVLALALMLTAGCLPQRATNEVVYLVGFPEPRVGAQQTNGPWSGTARCFRSSDGELFYITILVEADYARYCTALLETNGITKCEVKELGSMSYREPGDPSGFLAHPDRVEAAFQVRDKVQGTMREVRLVYTLPESSRALGNTADFAKLGHSDRIGRCAQSVAADMKNIAQELVRKLKDG
jgi:hypothetical protein